ncbi:hypothetical protein RUM43_010739 [Polyplax serrata]|uniref:Uncharacterized protein n=1 Tax=Polyplax serrata TaxID=468196 RepID=A0AAN8PLQ3_POLSC
MKTFNTRKFYISNCGTSWGYLTIRVINNRNKKSRYQPELIKLMLNRMLPLRKLENNLLKLGSLTEHRQDGIAVTSSLLHRTAFDGEIGVRHSIMCNTRQNMYFLFRMVLHRCPKIPALPNPETKPANDDPEKT